MKINKIIPIVAIGLLVYWLVNKKQGMQQATTASNPYILSGHPNVRNTASRKNTIL